MSVNRAAGWPKGLAPSPAGEGTIVTGPMAIGYRCELSEDEPLTRPRSAALLHKARWAQIADYLRLLCDTDGIGRTDLRAAIEDCGTDFEFGDLAIEGARGEAVAE